MSEMEIFEDFIPLIDVALEEYNSNGYNLILSYVDDIIKKLMKLILNKKPYYHTKKKKFLNCEQSVAVETLNDKLLDILGDGSLNFKSTINESLVENITRALILTVPFCDLSFIDTITFTLANSINNFPVHSRKVVIEVFAEYLIPMNSITKGESDEAFQHFCEMMFHSTIGKVGPTLSDYLPLIESILYWSQHDMMQLLMNAALMSDPIGRQICIKAIIHYLSPIDIGENHVKPNFKCNNVFCKTKTSYVTSLVMDQTIAVTLGMTSPPLLVCNECTDQIKDNFKHGTYVPHKKPIPQKTLIYNTDLVNDNSYLIACQIEKCSNIAEYLSIAFHASKSTVNEIEFDSIAKYLCYDCHKLYPHTQCQYLFSISHVSKLASMTDHLIFEMYMGLFLTVLDKLESITLKYEKSCKDTSSRTAPKNHSTDFDHEENSSTFSSFFMLSKMLGFIVFYKETTFASEKMNRFSVSQWCPREVIVKNPSSHDNIVEIIVKSIAMIYRNKKNGAFIVSDNKLLDTFKDWLKIIYKINPAAYTTILHLKLKIPPIEHGLIHEIYIIIENSFKMLEALINNEIIPTGTVYEVFFQHLDVVIEMLHVERRFSKNKFNPKQLSQLKNCIKTIYNLVNVYDQGSISTNITEYINKLLSKNNDDITAKMMWKLRLLSYCGVNLSFQAVVDTIRYFLNNFNLIYKKYNDRLQYFMFETYADSNICLNCNKSSFFLTIGFVKENCCYRYKSISKKPTYRNEIGHAFYSFICLDLLLSTMIRFESNVCIIKKFSTKGAESLFAVAIDLVRMFSRDENYPQYKDMCRIFAGTLYFVIVNVSINEQKSSTSVKNEEQLDYKPIEFPSNNGTEFERLCKQMSVSTSTLPPKVRIGAIVGHMLNVLCLEDEHHDVCTAASLCTIIKYIFFEEKYFSWCMNNSDENNLGETTFTECVLPSLWTSQKYDDLATSTISGKIFMTICKTNEGFHYLVEEIIVYVENVLSKFHSAAASNVSNIHADTSNLEMLEQLSVCLYFLTLEGEWMKKYDNGVIFLLFCMSLLVLLQSHVHPNVACLSTEFLKNTPEYSQQILMECINMQYNFVPEDRLFLILISMAFMRTCNVYISRKNLLLWWNLSFSNELEDIPIRPGFNPTSKPSGISISSIRIFKEVYGTSFVSSFFFPKSFENIDSLMDKNTNVHSLFLVLLSYSIQTLAQINDVTYKEDILTLNDMFTKLLSTMDIKYKKSLLGIPFGKAKHVYLYFMWYLLDKNCNVGQFFVSSVISVLTTIVEDPGLNFLPTKNLLLEEKVVESIKDLVEPSDSLNNGIVSVLPEERHMFLKMLNLLLYKYNLAAHGNNLKLIISHIHNVLDGHTHICSKKKQTHQTTNNNTSDVINTGFESHNLNELNVCSFCGIPLFKVDNKTINLALITLMEFHMHNFKIGSMYLYKTLNLIYKFSYYDNLYGKFKDTSTRKNLEVVVPPIPSSITSVSIRCFYQLIFKLEEINFTPELFKMDLIEPYPFFYTLVFAIIVCDSFEAVLKFLSNSCRKFISDETKFFENAEIILKNFTILLHCSRDIILTTDTHAINHNVMKTREFLPDIKLDIVYGLTSTIFKNDKMNIAADLMVDTCSSFDSMIKMISSVDDETKISYQFCAQMVLALIKFNSTACFHYENLIIFIQKLFKSQNVLILTMVEIAVQWYCTSADVNDQLTVLNHLIDILLFSLRNLIVTRHNNDDRIKNIIVFFMKLVGTKLISNESFVDANNQNIVTVLETISSEASSLIMSKKAMMIYDTINKLYINPATGLSNRNSRTVMFHTRIEYARLPLAQVLAVLVEELSNFQKQTLYNQIFPWFNQKSIQQIVPSGILSMENIVMRMKDIFWLLFGRIAHHVNCRENFGGSSIFNNLNLGLVLSLLNNILDCLCKKKFIITKPYNKSKIKFLVTYYSILCVYGELNQEFNDDSNNFVSSKSIVYVFTCSLMWTEFLERILPNVNEYAMFASLLNTQAKFITAFVQDIYMTSCDLIQMGYLSPTCVVHLLEPFLVKIDQGLKDQKENINFRDSPHGSVHENSDSYQSNDMDERDQLITFTPVKLDDNKTILAEWFDRVSNELIDIEKQTL